MSDNPYATYPDLLLTCVDAPIGEVVTTMLEGLNHPSESSPRNCDGEPLTTHFARDVATDFSLAYSDLAERDTTKPLRILFWEPRISTGKTVFMGNFRDGMSHTISSLSLESPHTWINIRIYDDDEYPGCFFDYYTDHRKIRRRLMACKDDQGWEFALEGPIQPFENIAYYSKRLIKERLNRGIITEYLEKIGYMVGHQGFWESAQAAVLLWQERPEIRA